ncbi:hypothetical protein DFH08DRAFT_827502 [Mycena albidolilacea]|uniref:Uncharacterized protein n=1 Tax=Mycena albidolilacea TaxID=1033008 RepID=A0AAD7E786_9AGAR|nr:hypothetical protein DFH08DRAFT_827502 [Mycena albidolilacea]
MPEILPGSAFRAKGAEPEPNRTLTSLVPSAVILLVLARISDREVNRNAGMHIRYWQFLVVNRMLFGRKQRSFAGERKPHKRLEKLQQNCSETYAESHLDATIYLNEEVSTVMSSVPGGHSLTRTNAESASLRELLTFDDE